MTTKTKADENAPLTCLGAIVFLPLYVTATSLVSGFVGQALWNWFLVPATGIKPISLVLAIGVGMLVSKWSHSTNFIKSEYQESGFKVWVSPFVYNAIAYGLACILHRFFM